MTATTMRPQPMPAGRPCDVSELVALFAGCDLTDGHPNIGLAKRIILVARPATLGDLRRLVYADYPPSEVPAAGKQALIVAWTQTRLGVGL